MSTEGRRERSGYIYPMAAHGDRDERIIIHMRHDRIYTKLKNRQSVSVVRSQEIG